MVEDGDAQLLHGAHEIATTRVLRQQSSGIAPKGGTPRSTGWPTIVNGLEECFGVWSARGVVTRFGA